MAILKVMLVLAGIFYLRKLVALRSSKSQRFGRWVLAGAGVGFAAGTVIVIALVTHQPPIVVYVAYGIGVAGGVLILVGSFLQGWTGEE